MYIYIQSIHTHTYLYIYIYRYSYLYTYIYIHIYMNIDYRMWTFYQTMQKTFSRLPSSHYNNHGGFKIGKWSKTGLTCWWIQERTYIIFRISMTAQHLLKQQISVNCLHWIVHDMATMTYICAGLFRVPTHATSSPKSRIHFKGVQGAKSIGSHLERCT